MPTPDPDDAVGIAASPGYHVEHPAEHERVLSDADRKALTDVVKTVLGEASGPKPAPYQVHTPEHLKQAPLPAHGAHVVAEPVDKQPPPAAAEPVARTEPFSGAVDGQPAKA